MAVGHTSGHSGLGWRAKRHAVNGLAHIGAMIKDRVASGDLAERLQTLRRRWRRLKAFPFGRSRRPVFLFLAPEAGLEPFYASHVLLARLIADAGHSTLLLSCQGIQPLCTVKMAMQIEPTPSGNTDNVACRPCLRLAQSVGDDYRLVDRTIESFLSPDDRRTIEGIVAAAPEPWTVTYDGIELGGACLAETLRARRKTSVAELTDDDKNMIRGLLYSTLAIYLALLAIERRFRIARIFYFGDYAYLIPPQVFAQRRAVPLTHVSHAYNRDIDRRYLSIRPGLAIGHMLDQAVRWERYRDRSLPSTVVAEIIDGGLYRLGGQGGASTYSPNWQSDTEGLLRELNLDPSKKTLVAYTSSMDELLCIRQFMRTLGREFERDPTPFADQESWLGALVAWVGKRNALQLIVRLHPRIGDTHRQAGRSSQYEKYRADLASVPSNVAVVWPESKLSSYSIAEFAAVALTSWSSIGLEMARFGIPVVAAFPRINPFPVGSFIAFDRTPEGYFQAIERALDQPASLDHIREAIRWTHFLHWSPTIDVSDVTPTHNYDHVPPYREPKSRETILKVMVDGEELEALNMAKLSGVDAGAEREAVIAGIEKTLVFFMARDAIERSPAVRVALSPGGRAPAPEENTVRLVVEPNDVVCVESRGQVTRRTSVLVARLARLLAQHQSAVTG